jgi:hypothetical protein
VESVPSIISAIPPGMKGISFKAAQAMKSDLKIALATAPPWMDVPVGR